MIRTFVPMQSPTGGFGGGFGQTPHLACSYATVLSLAIVGGTEAYSLINREAMWHWLGRLKHPSGGFQVCEGGEMDTRGAYTAMVLVTLLDLPLNLPEDSPAKKVAGLQTFTDNLPEWLSSCQTFQGGIGGSPGNEAHGAYTFLAIACLCLLDEPPHISLRKYLDLDSLIQWLSSVQNAPEGGFAGRMNKLVDGCYSHWCGGCFPLVQAALLGQVDANTTSSSTLTSASTSTTDQETAQKLFPHQTPDLYSREGLVRYTLCCCQQKHGGLRDKPGKYVICYLPLFSLFLLFFLLSSQYHHAPPCTLTQRSHTQPTSIYVHN